MKLCKLCIERPADKTNTHYLTDGIIRSCLNVAGSNEREKAMAFDISLDQTSIEPRFQRNTSLEEIVKNFGREATEIEIENAKTPFFAVDHVFCSECEKKFTAIESPFLQHILPKLRGKDFTGKKEIDFNSDQVREFFLLQVYRLAVCDPGFQLSADKLDKLRQYFNAPKENVNMLKSIPLQVSYLNTLGGDEEYTTNAVGIATQGNNRSVIFNDFIIQISADDLEMYPINLYGINAGTVLSDFTNVNEEIFRIRIIENTQRKAFYAAYHKEKAEKFKNNYRHEFTRRYFGTYGLIPNPSVTETFVNAIIHEKDVEDESKYSKSHFEKTIAIYLNKYRPR